MRNIRHILFFLKDFPLVLLGIEDKDTPKEVSIKTLKGKYWYVKGFILELF